jgi:hypothetical protein
MPRVVVAMTSRGLTTIPSPPVSVSCSIEQLRATGEYWRSRAVRLADALTTPWRRYSKR